MSDPRQEYGRRLSSLADQARALQRTSGRISAARGGAFIGMSVLAGLVVWGPLTSYIWAVILSVVFLGLVVIHERVGARERRVSRLQAHYESGLARLDHGWMGTGPEGLDYFPFDHPYAYDLDLAGPASLFQLLNRARTGDGERTLAAWLSSSAAPVQLQERQTAVRELGGALEQRERLALAGRKGSIRLHGERLDQWAAVPHPSGLPLLRAVTAVLAAAMVLTFWGWWFSGWTPWPFAGFMGASYLWTQWISRFTAPALAKIESPARELATLAKLMPVLEDGKFESKLLIELNARVTGDRSASKSVSALGRRVEMLDWARNDVFAPFAALLLWRSQVALALEAWRRAHGEHVAGWLLALGEFEALHSLASHHFEHPDDVFAQVEEGRTFVDAKGIAHPLLPEASEVRNDLKLGGDESLLWIVSGSNMSGKSTMLRSLGCNTVLALAGAPVRAERFVLSPLQVAASIQAHDSLAEGASRFRAELTRLRAVFELTDRELPVLFLLDEIFHGTHSHDRRIGAQALLKRLLKRGAIGLVTTHDLALTELPEELAAKGRNVHFADQMQDGVMTFDYRVRDGVVQRSNALALMRAEGLIE